MEGCVKSFREGNPLPVCRSWRGALGVTPGENRILRLKCRRGAGSLWVAVHEALSCPGAMGDGPACPGGLQK